MIDTIDTAGLGTHVPILFYVKGNYVSPNFNPAYFTNLYAWFSANDMVTPDGTSISGWTDKSSNHRDATSSGYTAPVIKTGILNGYPALNFRSGNALIFSGNPIPTSWTVFTVAFRTGTDSPISPIDNNFPTGFNNFLGYVGEVIIYDRELSSHESNLVTTYLENKWGV